MNKHIVKHIVNKHIVANIKLSFVHNPKAQRLLYRYFIAAATTRQHMHYYTTDLKYETVLARNIQRVRVGYAHGMLRTSTLSL